MKYLSTKVTLRCFRLIIILCDYSNFCFLYRIFQSYGATNCRSNNENVCITVPPVMCIDWNGNQYGECRCDILIDHIRLNLSVSFLIDLFRFFVEAVSYGQDDLVNSNTVGVKTFNTAVTNSSGLVNYGYVGESIDVSM